MTILGCGNCPVSGVLRNVERCEPRTTIMRKIGALRSTVLLASVQLIDEKHPQRRFVLSWQDTTLFGYGAIKQGQGRLRNIDAAGIASGFQAGGDIDGVTPDIDAMFAQAASYCRARMHANADFPCRLTQSEARAVFRRNVISNRQAGGDGVACVVRAGQWDTRDRHIGVADGFNRREIEALTYLVEGAEVAGESSQERRGLQRFGVLSEADEIGE